MLSRRLLTLLAGLLLAVTAVVVAPSSPALAAGCYGSGCTGRDPQVQGCSPDARMPAASAVRRRRAGAACG